MTKDIFDAKPEIKRQNRLPQNPDPESKGRFPRWLHMPMLKGETLFSTDEIIKKYKLNTVCEEAKCPNRLECYSKKTATFLLLGKECTRACGFCEIDFSKTPKAPEVDEPIRVALSVKQLGLKHVVLTMVARDDLEDGGALHLSKVIEMTRVENQNITIEVLTSDFAGNLNAVDTVLNTLPEIFNYNIETVRRLTPSVRHKATYDRTLQILSHIKKSKKARFVKSGLMIGLGETKDEIFETINDLHEAGVDIITIGQYLQPSKNKLSVKEFIPPETFKIYEDFAISIGVKHIYAGPFVRSSHNAEGILKILTEKTLVGDTIPSYGNSTS
jgi:lipoic acid synthetase